MEPKEFDTLIEKILAGDRETPEEIEDTYQYVSEFMGSAYDFILSYHEYLYNRVDYGVGLEHTMIEIHILTEINDSPGINSTTLANRWSRNTSTMSSIIAQLEKEDLIYRERSQEDRKVLELFVTPKGKELVLLHKEYDINAAQKDFKIILETLTKEDLRGFYNVSQKYALLIEQRSKY